MAVYAAMIDSMDRNIGRLMQTLADLGIKDNTIVMFLSDNGGCAEEPGGSKLQRHPVDDPGSASTYMTVGPSWGWAQNAPFKRYKANTHEGGVSATRPTRMKAACAPRSSSAGRERAQNAPFKRYKANTHEGGVRTPLIVRWPGKVKPNTITHQPGHIIDFMATFVDLAGTQYPQTYKGNDIIPLEGKSLVPVFLGRKREPHDYLAWHWAGNRAVRVDDWKLVWDKDARPVLRFSPACRGTGESLVSLGQDDRREVLRGQISQFDGRLERARLERAEVKSKSSAPGLNRCATTTPSKSC